MSGCPSRLSHDRQGWPRGVAFRSTASRLLAAGGTLAVVAAAVVSSAGAASASEHPAAFWVSLTGTPTGANVSCQTAAYSTVQSAVTAAQAYEALHPGKVPTVDVCPGTYDEQVTILHSLVLTRAPVDRDLGRAVIRLPAAVGSDQSLGLSTTNCQAGDATQGIQFPQSVIEICSAGPGGSNISGVHVTVRGLTVEGNWPTTVCYDSLYGILVGGGASLSLSGSTLKRIGAYPLNGCQGGVGVQVGLAPTGQVGHAQLSDDTIETYQKNGVTIDGPGSSADIDSVVVAGAGATPAIAQNGIQISFGATGTVDDSTITGNNYTGKAGASSTGILAFGGGGSVCGIGPGSPLVKNAEFSQDKLAGNDIGIALFNVDPTCTKSVTTPTRNSACADKIGNSHGYPGGVPSADANISGFGTVGYQAGVSDTGDHDVICNNTIYGAGYYPRDATSSLPNPPPPAFVRPIDVVSIAAIHPVTYGNTFDGSPYHPGVAMAAAAAPAGGHGHRHVAPSVGRRR